MINEVTRTTTYFCYPGVISLNATSALIFLVKYGCDFDFEKCLTTINYDGWWWGNKIAMWLRVWNFDRDVIFALAVRRSSRSFSQHFELAVRRFKRREMRNGTKNYRLVVLRFGRKFDGIWPGGLFQTNQQKLYAPTSKTIHKTLHFLSSKQIHKARYISAATREPNWWRKNIAELSLYGARFHLLLSYFMKANEDVASIQRVNHPLRDKL